MSLVSVKNLYTLTWISSLLFVVNLIRQYASNKAFAESAEWDMVYFVVRTTINAILAICLLWVTRKKKSLEGEFGWKVAMIMLFLIDWATYARQLSDLLKVMTAGRVVAWGVFIAVIAFAASVVVSQTSPKPARQSK